MDLRLTNKVVIVTGGAKGIGKSITLTLAEEGAIPVIFSRNPEEATEVADEITGSGDRCLCRTAELTQPDEIKTAVESVLGETGGIHGIVNNAGVNDGVGLEAGPEAFAESLAKNLTHYYTLVHYALPALKKQRGAIVNIGSKVASTGQGGTSAYAAAKGGINGMTREWALDLASDHIRVNAVIPAEVRTPLYERFLSNLPDPESARTTITSRIPLERRFTTCEEIANTTVFLLSPRSSHTTGQILFVDGGYTHLDRMDGAFEE